jgi:hypothetical protein
VEQAISYAHQNNRNNESADRAVQIVNLISQLSSEVEINDEAEWNDYHDQSSSEPVQGAR